MSDPQRYWQSLEELADEPGLAARRRQELPGGETLWEAAAAVGAADAAGGNRRDFLKLMGFSLAAASAASCTRIPERRAVPLLDEPAEMVPGVANYYATTCAACPAGCGLLVKSRDGRPIKIEGNPDSPLSGGATCAVGQAAVLGLYDDHRLKAPLWKGAPATWPEIDAAVGRRLAAAAARGGTIALLTGTLHSPATLRLIADWQRHYPGSRHVVHDPVSLAAMRLANEESFGRAVVPHYRFDRARLIVGIEADFLGTWLSPVEFSRQYVAGRRLRGAPPALDRHVQIEAGLTLTGAAADLRLACNPSQLGLAALVLLARVGELAGAPLAPAPGALETPGAGAADRAAPDLTAAALAAALPAGPALLEVAGELWRRRGESLVVCGANDRALQLVVNRLNALLGNVGATLDLERPSRQAQGDERAVAELLAAMERGEIHALLMLGVNPLYDHPEAARFAAALERVGLTVSFAERRDETARAADAVCPDHHFLESWNDAQPVDGWWGLTQPAIAPLFDTRAAQASLLTWMGAASDYHAYLREHWRREVFPHAGRGDFDDFWDRALEAGGFRLPGSDGGDAPATAATIPAVAPAAAAAAALAAPAAAAMSAAAAPSPNRGDAQAAAALLAEHHAAEAARRAGLHEVQVYETVALRRGGHANNPWLQELPDPITKATWGNYAAMAPRLAARLGVEPGDVVTLRRGGAALTLPVLVQPGHAPEAISVALGYGRSAAGKVGDGVGANAFPVLAHGAAPDGLVRGWAAGFSLEKTGRREALATTQTHHTLDGRDIVRETTLDACRRGGRAVADGGAGPAGAAAIGAFAAAGGEAADAEAAPDLWPEYVKEGHFWGMAIDANSCTGCAACVVACQAENNVAVVGKDEVRRGREMHWIRIDRYYRGTPEDPATVFQPMMCQHCDHAPCETVCPVLATVHSSDGLNQQVYNRCVGTRYCENNCPYKVRRFNWFNYAGNPRFDYATQSELGRMVLNPDVVVRSRGVMEKCSLCIQRIQEGKLRAKQRRSALADGEIKTACQQACPGEAIVFGDLNDPASEVSRRKHDPRYYQVLAELGTRPGVGYLAKIRNPLAASPPAVGAARTGGKA